MAESAQTESTDEDTSAEPTQKETSRHLLATAFGLLAGLIVLIVTLVASDLAAPLRSAYLCSALAIFLASALFYRRICRSESVAVQAIADAVEAKKESEQAKLEVESASAQAKEKLEEIAGEIQRREEVLSQRLVRFHEWLEYPLDDELLSADEAEFTLETLSAEESEELAELQRKDQEVQTLLEDESRILFEKIQNNAYSVEGKFDYRLLRDDALDLATRVAQVYQEDSEQPLLETSMSQVLQALSRASLHYIILLEELPVDVRDMSISDIYAYIRKAVAAYGTYKSARPYLAYARGAYYAGRIAMGANPVFLGAEFVVRSLGTKGAAILAKKYVNQQAIALLASGVRVIGYEVAHIYGGNFRHRDPNWILGCEIVELASAVPLTRAALSTALQRLTALPLRSEYDRILLYRCLAQQKSVKPGRFKPNVVLNVKQRTHIARTIESLLRGDFAAAVNTKSFNKWVVAFESRQEIKLQLGNETNISDDAQVESAIRSLVGFALDLKEYSTDDAISFVEQANLVKAGPGLETAALLTEIRENPPFFFEYPELVPTSKISEAFLDDLVSLVSHQPPFSEGIDDVTVDVGISLRRSEKKIRGRLNDAYLAQLNASFAQREQYEWPAQFARSILSLVDEGELPKAFYTGAEVDCPNAEAPAGEIGLVATDRRVALLTNDGHVLWQSDSSTSFQRKSGMLRASAQLSGGTWFIAEYLDGTIRIPGETFGNFDDYFTPITALVGRMTES